MKQVVVALAVVLAGCASSPPGTVVTAPAPASTPLPVVAQSMRPVAVDCRYAEVYNRQLEYTIANNVRWNAHLDASLAAIVNRAPDQMTRAEQVSAAKTMLWTVRTVCPVF